MAATAVALAQAAEQLRAGANQFGLDLEQAQIAQMLQYLELLERWGSSFNLTAVREAEAMVVTHLLDSLSIVPLILDSGAKHWIDAGSGAGLPGIPIAIALPQIKVTSVDAVQKKIAFQTQIKGTLKLANFFPVHARVQTLTLDMGFDAAMFRAFASLHDGLEGIDAALPEGAPVIAMKAHLDDQEVAAVGASFRVDAIQPLLVPGLNAKRCAVLLTRRSGALSN